MNIPLAPESRRGGEEESAAVRPVKFEVVPGGHAEGRCVMRARGRFTGTYPKRAARDGPGAMILNGSCRLNDGRKAYV